MTKFENHRDPLDVLFDYVLVPDADYRQRLLIEWCKKHVKEFSVQRFTQIKDVDNKNFAEYSERQQLFTLMEGIVKEAPVNEAKGPYGARYTKTVRIII